MGRRLTEIEAEPRTAQSRAATTAPKNQTRAMPGPSLGPTMPVQDADEGDNPSSNPSSPYSAAQLAIRNLTMPPVPNFEIPASPPDSPPPESTKKFAHFLELKKAGVLFNSKLQDSSALRNPGLFQKLMDYAGIGEQGQYASALPENLATPVSFPSWVYADELNKTQQKVLKKKENEKSRSQRERLDFVTATEPLPILSSRSGALVSKGIPNTAADKVKAGLDRVKLRSPQTQEDGGRQRRRFRSRSRSPKRRRSRSR
jgi:HCNGP-like protein